MGLWRLAHGDEGGRSGDDRLHSTYDSIIVDIASPGMKRKIAAILAADVAEYSRLVAEDEEDALRRLVAAQTVFKESVALHRGRIFNTAGDAILAEFASAVDAARSAIDIQERMSLRNKAYPANRQLTFRIGLSIGDVVEHEGDLLGDGVNIAARLQGLAPTGGLAISHWVREQIAGKVPVTLRDTGAQNLKNIPQPVHVYVADLGQAGSGALLAADLAAPSARIMPIWFAIAGAAAVAIGLFFSWGRIGTPVVSPPESKPVAAPAPVPTVAPVDTKQAAPVVVPPIMKDALQVPLPPAPQSGFPPAMVPKSASGPPPVAAPVVKEGSPQQKRSAQSCSEVLERAQLGDLSTEDRAFLRNQCR